MDAAVEAAARSFPEWAMKSLDDRKEYIKSFYDKFKEVKVALLCQRLSLRSVTTSTASCSQSVCVM